MFKILRYGALFGNGMYILWIVRNGINEGFNATPVQKASLIGLILLLIFNMILLYRKKV